MKFFTAALILLMLFSSSAMAVSVLRVHCSGDDEGAKIFINGEFKGNCPADLFLPSGETTLRAVKPVDEKRERAFETSFILMSDGARRVMVELSQPQLTVEEKRKAAVLARKKAEQGDTAAMRELAGYYRKGKGVPENPEKAGEWLNAARALDEKRAADKTLEQAQSGNIGAMFRIAKRYESGTGVEQDNAKAEEWLERAKQTEVEAARRKAEQGNYDAMRTLATYYAKGWGVEKSPAKAREWASRADRAQTEAMNERERARERAEAERRNAYLQYKIDNTQFFPMTQTTFDSVTENPSIGVFTLPFSPVTAFEGTTAATNATRVARWKSQMTSRPAAFENPDSMIARASANSRKRTD